MSKIKNLRKEILDNVDNLQAFCALLRNFVKVYPVVGVGSALEESVHLTNACVPPMISLPLPPARSNFDHARAAAPSGGMGIWIPPPLIPLEKKPDHVPPLAHQLFPQREAIEFYPFPSWVRKCETIVHKWNTLLYPESGGEVSIFAAPPLRYEEHVRYEHFLAREFVSAYDRLEQKEQLMKRQACLVKVMREAQLEDR